MLCSVLTIVLVLVSVSRLVDVEVLREMTVWVVVVDDDNVLVSTTKNVDCMVVVALVTTVPTWLAVLKQKTGRMDAHGLATKVVVVPNSTAKHCPAELPTHMALGGWA